MMRFDKISTILHIDRRNFHDSKISTYKFLMFGEREKKVAKYSFP